MKNGRVKTSKIASNRVKSCLLLSYRQKARPDNHIESSFEYPVQFRLEQDKNRLIKEPYMKLYGVIDLHSNNCVVVLVDEDSREVLRKRIDNDLSNMIALLEPYRSDITGLVVESTYNWYWLVDGLMEAGFKVHLTNTAAIQQYSEVKHTNSPIN